MKRKIRKAAALLAGMALLTGCEMIDAIEMSSWEPQEVKSKRNKRAVSPARSVLFISQHP